MYNFFEYLYSPSTNYIYYGFGWIFVIAAIVALMIAIAFIIDVIKTKNYKDMIPALVLLLFFYIAIPTMLDYAAVIFININDKAFYRCKTIAAKLSMFPAQKGFLYLHVANRIVYNYKLSIYYYEKAYKYLKRYDSLDWTMSALIYYLSGNFDKTIEIGKAISAYDMVTMSYIMKNDYKNALISVNKLLELRPNNKHYWAIRANLYRYYFNNRKQAELDYQKALQFCEEDKCVKHINEVYNNKNYVRDDWNEHRTIAKSNGVVY